MHEKRHFLSYRKRRHDAQITWPYAYHVTLGSHCKMANSSSEDETDTFPERPTRIQPYQFEPARQDFERVPVFHGVCEIALTEVRSLHKWAWCGAARKSDRLNCRCEQVLFVYVFTIIPPRLTDQRNFITVLIVTREPEQRPLLFWSAACGVTPNRLHTADRR